MSDVSKVLREARRLIADVGWTTDAYARTASGKRVWDPLDVDAVCFCSIGAICRAKGACEANCQAEIFALRAALPDSETREVDYWNDSRSDVSEVLTAFDKAIALAEAAE